MCPDGAAKVNVFRFHHSRFILTVTRKSQPSRPLAHYNLLAILSTQQDAVFLRGTDMKNICFGIAALATLIAAPAFAADMPLKAPMAPPPAPVYSWTGFYIGGNVGWLGMDRVNLTATPNDAATAAAFGPCLAAGACPNFIGNTRGNGVIGGGQIGYNWQVQNWVLGIEADAQGTGARTSNSIAVTVPPFVPFAATASVKEQAFGTVRGRAGVLVSPMILAYATGGFAWASVKESLSGGFPSVAGTFAGSNTTTDFGWTVGAGLEWALGNGWTVGAEYLFARLDGSNSNNNLVTAPTGAGCVPGGVPVCQFRVTTSNFDNNIARFKFNYKFF
jgi:outer membrane immunogenic protein